MVSEFCVRHDVYAIKSADGREIIEHMLNHRLARDRQQRLRLRQRKRIKSGGVSGGQNYDFHAMVWDAN